MTSVLLTNAEYNFLLRSGGDELIAFFATLRHAQKSTSIRKVGKKGPCALIGSVTGLSRTTVNKYLPRLLDFDMVAVHGNGNIAIRSRKWADKNLPRMKNRKLIPIKICEKFADTKISSKSVRIHSNIISQKSQIGRKAERIKLFKQHQMGRTRCRKDLKFLKTKVKQGESYESLAVNYRSISTISNLGFDILNKVTKNPTTCNKSSGHYLKSKLLKRGFIVQNRNVRLAYPVRDPKFLQQLREETGYGSFFMGSQGIYYEESPEIELGKVARVGFKKKQVRK